MSEGWDYYAEMAKGCGEVLGLFFVNKLPHFWGDHSREITEQDDLLVTWGVKNSHSLQTPLRGHLSQHLGQGDSLNCHNVHDFSVVLEEMAEVSTQAV